MTVPSEQYRRVLLIGMMASGKSTIGAELSRRLGWHYADNDELVLRAVGENLDDLLQHRGANALRDAEAKALAVALGDPGPLVAGVAAGVVLREADRQRIRAASDALAVYLRARPETLTERVGSNREHRPWLGDDPLGWFRSTLHEREPLYREVADVIVDVDEAPPAAIADQIVSALRAGGSSGQ